MNGTVDNAGRALLKLNVRSNENSNKTSIAVWIDTAFDGEMVLSSSVIQQLQLQQSASVQATLADGSAVILETYGCQIEWFGAWRQIEVVANEGKFPLLGIGLLKGRKLQIDYQLNKLYLE